MSHAHLDADSAALSEAAAWQVYFESSGQRTSAEFVAWLNASPLNDAAWRRVHGAWNLLEAHEDSDQAAELRRQALADADASRASAPMRWWSSMGVGRQAAAALVLVIVGMLGMWSITRPETYRTDSGERRVVTLSDQSRVTLDADTEVQVRYSKQRRDLALLRGQARFDVAHDASRPFSVVARDRQIVALGTSFNVDLVGQELLVTLLKGRIVVLPESANIELHDSSSQGIKAEALAAPSRTSIVELTAGEQLVVPVDATPSVVPVSTARVSAWESGHLVFDDEPLESVAERMSHYSSRRLIIADARAAQVRVSGFFNAGDTDGFVSIITEYLPVNAAPNENGDIRLSHR